MKVTARARSRDDRAGDPLDGLVNLFDLGIVLSVAFLLAALSSLNLTDALTGKEAAKAGGVPADAVVAKKGDRVKEIQLNPDERVVGTGKPLGTVYRLDDGRTVLVPTKQRSPAERDAHPTFTTPEVGQSRMGRQARPAFREPARE